MATASNRKPGRPASEEIKTRREEEILDAAARLFAQRGYSDANTQELADLLQVGKGTIYRYFPTKQDLFFATVDRGMMRLKAAVDESVEGIEEPFSRMTQGINAYLTYFAEHPEFAELMIQERAHFRDRKMSTYFVHRERNVSTWRDLMRSLIAEGRVRDVPVERITDVIGDLLYGTVFTNYFAGRNRSPEDQARDIVDIAFHGILSDSERERRKTQQND